MVPSRVTFLRELVSSVSSRPMGSPWILGVAVILTVCLSVCGLEIPLEIEQPPTITKQAPSSLIAFPLEDNFTLQCEARGNPAPEYHWTKNGQSFNPHQDHQLMKEGNSGTFVIPNGRNITHYGGRYRCLASNKLGMAVTEETDFIVPNVPKFPKETIKPIVVDEGQPIVLECNPPTGIPPRDIYWMTVDLKYIEQDERVSVGLDGNLYFSNAVEKDSRQDYCCFAFFPNIRTIVQKTAMTVVVISAKSTNDSDKAAAVSNATLLRKPRLMSPPGAETVVRLADGDDLHLECIPEGLPTPVIHWAKMEETLPAKANLLNYGKRLTISGVSAEDDGTYTCEAGNSAGNTAHAFHVIVEEPPRWVRKPENVLGTPGSDVRLSCSATGKPPPTITWMMNGHVLEDLPASHRQILNGELLLRHVTPQDSAVYQCQASNRHGTILANANVMVLNLAPMILTEDKQEYGAMMGATVFLHCRTFSSPPSVISWTKDKERINSVEGERFSIQKDGSLCIHSVQKTDSGMYSCFASNAEGRASISAALHIKDPTKIMEPPQDLQVLKGATANFTCQAEYDKSLRRDFEIRWEKGGTSLSITENPRYIVEGGVLQIVNVSHSDHGFYACVARTGLDQDRAVAQLTVLDVPGRPLVLILAEHQNRSVKLYWVPGDSHNITITDFIIEYEESQWEPGRWKELSRVAGNHTSARLQLHGHLDYRFRVSAVSGVGRGPASEPTERYMTPPSAPDKNPKAIKSEGNSPQEMSIHWEPLLPIEYNGPGLEYKVSYRRRGVEKHWQEHMVKRNHIIVRNTPTFVPYEVKVQARNVLGWAPEPEVFTLYSGEDIPTAAPDDVAVEVMNSTLIRVTWAPVPQHHLRGHLRGYLIQLRRLLDLLNMDHTLKDKQSLTVYGDRNQTQIHGVVPYSEYNLTVSVFNGRGSSPGSKPVTFRTPEGVPGKISILKATNAQSNSITLVWVPPLKANGILTGYLLQYQISDNVTGLLSPRSVNISGPDSAKWVVSDLEAVSKYKFFLSACSRTGCGPAIREDGQTIPEASASSASRSEITHQLVIGSMCAAVIFTFVVLIACFIKRNKAGKYSVKENEDLRSYQQPQNKNGSYGYSDTERRVCQDSLRYINQNGKANVSAESLEDCGESLMDCSESLDDCGDDDDRFGEDGSFIGEYSSCKDVRLGGVRGTAPNS
nr:neural cell adhesion molecule L1-like protein isoform X2 [Paramormyrops kingsleyae]